MMAALATEYVIQHGVSGQLGRFRFAGSSPIARGDSVVIRSRRGLETGHVLCPADRNPLDADGFVGEILRTATAEDAAVEHKNWEFGQSVYRSAKRIVNDRALPISLIDVEVAFDRQSALLQAIRLNDCDLNPLLTEVGREHDLIVRLYELNAPAVEDAHGCGTCGSGGGCGSCSAGGCSSCSSGAAAELQEYFAGLRAKIEHGNRLALL